MQRRRRTGKLFNLIKLAADYTNDISSGVCRLMTIVIIAIRRIGGRLLFFNAILFRLLRHNADRPSPSFSPPSAQAALWAVGSQGQLLAAPGKPPRIL